jgi:hypothetical protein
MRARFWLLPFATSLTFSGAVGAVEPESIVPKTVNAAPQFSEKVVTVSGHFPGFSPFMEEGLVLDLPGAITRNYRQMIVPAYLREFAATSD